MRRKGDERTEQKKREGSSQANKAQQRSETEELTTGDKAAPHTLVQSRCQDRSSSGALCGLACA